LHVRIKFSGNRNRFPKGNKDAVQIRHVSHIVYAAPVLTPIKLGVRLRRSLSGAEDINITGGTS